MAQVMARRRRWLIIVVGIIAVIAIFLGAFSGFWVDLLWFREVHFSGVFWSVFWSKVVLGLIFGALFFVLLAVNLFIAQRLTPRYRPFSPEQELIERYRAAFESRARLIILGFSALIALFVGIAASGQWQTFLLWRSAGGVSFPAALNDPLFHRNPAFYIFSLPFQHFVQGWFFSALVGVTVIVGIAHYLSGGIRTQTVGEKVTPQVKAHLSVLLGFIVLVKAWGYWLGRFDLLISPRGVVTGASYTDVHAQLPALTLLVFIAIACSALFLVNIRFRGWALPVLGIGLLALTSIVAGTIFPAGVQKFSVGPNELSREQPYIDDNIAGTRFAFGIDKITLTDQTVTGDVTAQKVDANQATIDNVRVWNPGILQGAYDQLQRFQPYYEFQDVDVDRYDVNGERRVVMLSPREVSQDGIPAPGGTWLNAHLVYTHGYAAVASQVNTATPEGAPLFLLDNVPPISAGIDLPSDTSSQIYYGERADVPYVVVGGEGQRELDYPNPTGQGRIVTTYGGEGGISLGGFFQRLLFAYRYRDVNLLISGQINGSSKILINRDIKTRVTKAAPFLKYDGDPYSAVVDGKLVYIWDAYTTTDRYPYSQELSLSSATLGDMSGRANYIRNSVKAVVDAYNGTVTFYVVDDQDPLIQVWERAFPGLFTPVSQASPDLVAHFRYPENLLQIQATQYANYHVTNAETFYGREQFWSIPVQLAQAPKAEPTDKPMRPYYVQMKLPGETGEEFVLFMPLTPFNRPNMVAYLAARSDPEHYGQVVGFELRSDQTVSGPQQVRAIIDNDPNVSSTITLLSQQGSNVKFGDLLVVPVEDSFLYVQPIFVESSQQNAIPELKRVAVVHGGQVSLANSLQAAIDQSFGQQPGGEPPPPPGTQVAELLAAADAHFAAADAALKNGDLATYQREIQAGIALVEQARQLAEQQAGVTPTPSPSPTPSPTPSASPTA